MLLVYAFASEIAGRALGRGLEGEVLERIDFDGFFAVVGRVAAAPAVSPEAALAFDGSMRRIHEAARAMLPARFGSVARDRAQLEVLIAETREPLLEALELVAGRAQMTLRLSGRAEPPPPVIETRAASGGEYLAQKLEQHRRARAIPELEPVRALFEPLIAAEETERHSAPPWFASAYHLLDRPRGAEYARVAQGAAAILERRGVHLDVRGPLPPYAFGPGVFP